SETASDEFRVNAFPNASVGTLIVTLKETFFVTFPEGQFHVRMTGAEFTNSAWVPSVRPLVCAVSVLAPANVLRYLKVTEFVPLVIVTELIVALSVTLRNVPALPADVLRATIVSLVALTGFPPA